ncbi:hypothetical protein FB561_0333 [Kribbella amoyensis]|uniref:Uncharacterized protein n=1 Tax=Kribbella amoyensis TaxID=996641 RepID=A0A561BK74_9ACTN|nr:hypothetical protein [Kribbella amoyensis]TWD79277.1 hypothetical protein FB561_0333 [Kribbella amoyensis]
MIKRRLFGVATATLLVLPALAVLTSRTASAAPEFNYTVGKDGSGTIRSIPQTQRNLDLVGGEQVYLYSTGLSVTRKTTLSSGDNPGTTFILRCSGPGLSGSEQLGVYSAQNMITPAEWTTAGVVRWLLIAPESGRFSCELAVSSYARNDTIDRVGPIAMRVNAGSALNVSPVGDAQDTVKAAARWALPHQEPASNYVLWSGATRTNGYTYPVRRSTGNLAIVQDLNVTTCSPGDERKFPRCAGAPAYNGSTLDTWIEIQPQHLNGTSCAPLIKGAVRRTTIAPARHHKTVNDVLHVAKSQLGGCPRARTSLQVRHVSGAPTVIHSNWAGRIAPTHGIGYEY